jgi:hypothetical protein
MRRLALAALCLMTGCVTSPVYTPGLQHVALLKSRGDMSASYAAKADKGREVSATILLTDRFFVSGEYGDSPRAQSREAFQNTRSGLAVGWTSAGKDWRVQNAMGFGKGSTDESIYGGLWGVFTEGAPYMAVGRYSRIHVQRSAARAWQFLELGGSARLSGVKVTGYRRFAGTPTTDGGINRPYNRDTTFTGSLSGLFFEPSLFFGLNFRGIRVTPQLSMALPFTPTAFSAMPADAGVTFSVSSDIFKARPR